MSASKKNHRRKRSMEKVKAFRRFRVKPSVQNRIIRQFYQSLGTPFALYCLDLYDRKQFKDLVNLELEPRSYNDPTLFQTDYAALCFLRKSEFLKTGIDTTSVALQKFRESEQQCKLTNRRFKNLGLDPLFKGPSVDLLNRLVRKISLILNDFDVEELLDACAFGPGSSTTISGVDTSAVRKFMNERSTTKLLYQVFFSNPYLKDIYPVWFRDGALNQYEIEDFSKVITVNKNAKTKRTIAIEPGKNLWVQKGFGTIIRRKLKRCGVNLDSDEKNRQLCRRGSRDGSVCTVDFVSASDTISIEMLRQVLPCQWFTLLDTCRTRGYRFRGDQAQHTFHKFSSMGNGFTFELESLIFYSAALVCCDYLGIETSNVSVFGDDIVMPTEAYQLYREFTLFLGFTIGEAKSFANGSFRESCGSYYFAGMDVKPLFQKKPLKTLTSLVKFANALSLLAERCSVLTPGRDRRFEALHDYVISQIPEELRFFGDVVGGQGCIWANFDQAHPSKLRGQLEGFSFHCLKFTPVSVYDDSPGMHIAKLHALVNQPLTDIELNRGGLSGNLPRSFGSSPALSKVNTYSVRTLTSMRLGRISAQRWYNWGPWN